MYQPAPREFASVTALPPPPKRRRRIALIASGIAALLVAGTGAYVWSILLCGDCSPPIACAKRCPLNERLRDETLREQRLREQPKVPDRVEQ
jgi:hypothetical protein